VKFVEINMMNVQLTQNSELLYNQFVNLNESDQFILFNKLKESLYLKRFNSLLKSLENIELTYEEIAHEVDEVRQRRYNARIQNN
jgi:hypothetical protein